MSAPIHVTKHTFQAEVLDSSIPVFVDLWAPGCPPCRAITPVLERLAVRYEGRVKVVKVNVDEEAEIAAAFGVQSVPTLAVLRGSTVVDGQIGFAGAAAIEQMFERAGVAAAAK